MTSSYDERKLVAELKQGRREAFDAFLDAYSDRVFNLCRRMVDVQEAEDVAQEALVEICKSVMGFRGDSNLSTWVHRVAVNVCLEYRRKRRPDIVPMEDDFSDRQVDTMPDPGILAIRNEAKEELEAAIGKLPEMHRDVVILHELQGLTYSECASVLGCPVGTVKSRLSNAFGKLRELLKDYASEGEVAI